MIVFPNAKINLGLYITQKRQDGYHNLETLFYPVPWLSDVLEMVPDSKAAADSLGTSGFKVEGPESDNLVIKALQLLRDRHQIPPLRIHLHKAIPAGSGLGGGSSDAAFTLKLLNRLFQLHLTSTELEKTAARLGADCPFFIRNRPSLAHGIGDQLSDVSISLKDVWMMVVVPPVHISTAEAYRAITPQKPENPLMATLASPRETWRGNLKNDFEKELFERHPQLMKIQETLYAHDAFYASLSGSGSAIFGLFNKKPHIQWPKSYFNQTGQLE